MIKEWSKDDKMEQKNFDFDNYSTFKLNTNS